MSALQGNRGGSAARESLTRGSSGGEEKGAIRKGQITGVERLEEADRGQKEGTGARGGVLGGV